MKQILVIASVVMLLASCAPAVQKGPVTVGSFIDSEGAVLGGMMVQILQKAGFEVVDKTELGTPEVVRQALVGGQIDLTLDYSGSGQYYHEGKAGPVWSDGARGYEAIRDLDKTVNDLRWLTPAKANNTESLAVKRSFSEQTGITDLPGLAAYINAGKPLKLICAASYAENPLGLLGLEEAYGFKLKPDQLISLSSGNTAEMLKALAEGNDVNVSLVYGTDGALDQLDLVVLADPKSIPPVYWPTPVLRGKLADQYPEIETLLKPVFESLTLEALQKLNAKVALGGEDADTVAKAYLEANGFLAK